MVDWKEVVYGLAVYMLFVPMVFLGVNTFFPELPENTCHGYYYDDYRVAMPLERQDCNCTSLAEQEAYQIEQQECFAQYEDDRRSAEAMRYVGVMILSLLGSLVMLLPVERSISYGLFIGVVFTAFIATIRYIDTRSKLGFALLVALFALIVAFIQKKHR